MIISPLTIAYALLALSCASILLIIWRKVSNPWREADRMIRDEQDYYNATDGILRDERDYF